MPQNHLTRKKHFSTEPQSLNKHWGRQLGSPISALAEMDWGHAIRISGSLVQLKKPFGLLEKSDPTCSNDKIDRRIFQTLLSILSKNIAFIDKLITCSVEKKTNKRLECKNNPEIGHFRVPKSPTFKTWPSAQPSCENEFYLHENEKSFPYQRLST